MQPDDYDFLIIGAGFAGLVTAERLCNQHGKRCLVIDQRAHVGGNAHDYYDENGVLIHAYGPHYFRTNSTKILNYLSNFTNWIPAKYQVQVFRDNRYWSFPINLKTFEQYIGRAASPEEMKKWLENTRVPLERVTNSEEAIISQVGREWFKMFFEGYTLKQWKRAPRELSASVCGRIPIRTERDERYFDDKHQVLPEEGYHTLFNNLVKSCGSQLEVRLNTDFNELKDQSANFSHIIFTGMIDAYFDYKFGKLPYRSLRFEREYLSNEDILKSQVTAAQNINLEIDPLRLKFQPCVQVNYPGNEPFTRTVEAKHITNQQIEGTTIIREFPEDYALGKDPYYPVPNNNSNALYLKYKAEAEKLSNVSFLGRLGTYKYYNMDQVVGSALHFIDNFDFNSL